jgi:hypothetical protein
MKDFDDDSYIGRYLAKTSWQKKIHTVSGEKLNSTILFNVFKLFY